MRKATSESWRISLSVSCDTPGSPYTRPHVERDRGKPGDKPCLGRCLGFQVLVRGAVVALGKRCPLARLALPRRRAAARDAAVERTGLDLLLDEALCRLHTLRDRPRNVRLAGDREVAADVLEERAVRLREVERIGGETLHRVLARLENGAPRLDLRVAVAVRIDHVLDRPVNGSRVLIHAMLQLEGALLDHSLVNSYEIPARPLLAAD